MFLQMMFHNDSSYATPPQMLTLAGCQVDCPLYDWANILQKFMPLNYSMQCINNFQDVDTQENNEDEKAASSKNCTYEQNITRSDGAIIDENGNISTEFVMHNPTIQAIIVMVLLFLLALIVSCVDLCIKKAQIRSSYYNSYAEI